MLGSRDVAIVGMACIEPGAPDVEAFWANVVDGVDSVTEVPGSRWDQAAHFDPGYDSSRRKPDEEPKSISKWGGFVPDVGFDALSWGIPPASLASVDMAQLMALKVAAEARSSRDFKIIARTDARTALGLDEALRRGEAFLKAGADILFIESPETEDEMRRIGAAFDAPLLANMVEGGRTPILSRAELESIGYKIAIYPALGFLAMGAALEKGYAELKAGQDISVPLYDFRKFSELMGFDWVAEFERKYR